MTPAELTIWTVPQLHGDAEHGYGYRIRYGLAERRPNAPILSYFELKDIERTKTEAKVLLQDGDGGPWVLLAGFDVEMNDVELGLAAVRKLQLLRETADH